MDGSLCEKYVNADVEKQRVVAEKMGMVVEDVKKVVLDMSEGYKG